MRFRDLHQHRKHKVDRAETVGSASLAPVQYHEHGQEGEADGEEAEPDSEDFEEHSEGRDVQKGSE